MPSSFNNTFILSLKNKFQTTITSSFQEGGKQIQEGMEDNTTITHMDLRLTDSGQEAEYCINQILHRNQERERESKICEPPAPSKKILPQAAHRFKPTKA